ncbi:MAG: NYN domain-containing protein [Dehalococcoidia bacterium]|nr:NYN domain-containing protein [Dehalococcoidia bacterium]
MLTNVYIDGFNLYYRAVKNTGFKWLDLGRLATTLFPHDEIQSIEYFTAYLSNRPGTEGSRLRQLVYLRALQTIPNLTIHFGQFRSRTKTRPLVARPDMYVEVLDSEEKGSDVNLVTRLLMDAITENYEQAVLISNDADFAGAMLCVKNELNLKMTLVSPDPDEKYIPESLRNAATYIRRIRKRHMRESQFPDRLSDDRGEIIKPPEW